MKDSQVPRSPVFPPDKKWDAKPSTEYYESEITAMLRQMLEDEKIREDQRIAWARWRNEERSVRKP